MDGISQPGFLAHSRIESLIHTDPSLIEGADPELIRQASYDLRLGDEVYVVGRKAPEKLTGRHPFISLPPGQFALLITKEKINMPEKVMAFITIRSKYKFQGLVNISGFHVDPSYRGKLLFAVQNVGPTDIRLQFGEPTFTIFFATVDGEIRGKRPAEGITGIKLDNIQFLGGSSVTVAKLQKDIDQLRNIILIYGPLVVAVLGALFVLVWEKFLKP